MFQISRRRRVTDVLTVDIDADGEICIEITDGREHVECTISKRDARALAAELRFLASPPIEPG